HDLRRSVQPHDVSPAKWKESPASMRQPSHDETKSLKLRPLSPSLENRSEREHHVTRDREPERILREDRHFREITDHGEHETGERDQKHRLSGRFELRHGRPSFRRKAFPAS